MQGEQCDMKVLNLLTSGSYGGIEVYCRDIGRNSEYTNGFCFMFGEGGIHDLMCEDKLTVYSLSKYARLSLRRLQKLREIAEKYDVVIVHHGDPYLQMYYLVLRKLCPDKKYIRIIHSTYEGYKFQDYGKVKSLLCEILEQALLDKSDLTITVSDAVKNSYQEHFHMDTEKITTIYNGISVEKLEDGKRRNFKRNDIIRIVYVGRLVKEKGVHLLLEAFSQLSGRENYLLQIIGDGAARKDLEKYAEDLKVTDQTIFEGFQSNVGVYLCECNIFVLPTMYESFGISLVEAMAYQCICIANAVGGIPEIISDGENGFLAYETNAISLLNKLQKAVQIIGTDEETRIRENARKTAESFSIINTCIKLKSELEVLL